MTRPAFETAARLRKVHSCTEVLDREAPAHGLHPHRDADRLAAALRRMPDVEWARLAVLAAVRPLSPASREEVIAVYEARAERQPHRCPLGHSGCYRAACGEEVAIRAAGGAL